MSFTARIILTKMARDCLMTQQLGLSTQVAAEMLADLDGDLKPGEHWRLEVTDAARNKLYVIHFNSERMK
jgi:hypothetical protein